MKLQVLLTYKNTTVYAGLDETKETLQTLCIFLY
jgi:hypothetical protein